MISRSDNPFVKEIISGIDTKIVGKSLYHFKSIDSTNLFAKKLVKKGVEEGIVVVADVQTSGRGRKDRIWSSPKGGLWFSVVLYPNISPQQGMLITMASSIAIAQSIEEITRIAPVIKWPNDLIINGRKVCGILTEIDAVENRINYSIVGIGINVNNQLNDELKKIATSLLNEVGSKVSRVKLLRYILKSFDENYIRLISGDYDFINISWLSYSNIIGKKIQVQEDKTVITGKVTEIDNNGCLILDTDSGKIRIISGDIEYI
jgi:BirA family biotin operon repressor/biotin-[acetyl-CoA-carboxylase] ligase